MKPATLTRNPTLVTAVLSIAALAAYVGYRLAPTGPETESATFASALPDIVLDDLAGSPTPLRHWAGRPLLVNFWATWCGPCLREIPLLKSFQDEHGAIEVIGIAVDEVVEPVLEFADEMQFNYPVLHGYADGYEAMAVFGNDAAVMPFSVFVAPDGAVLGKHYGEVLPEQLDQFAQAIDLLESRKIGLDEARARLAEWL